MSSTYLSEPIDVANQVVRATDLLSALSDYQPLDDDLTAVAALETTSTGRALLTESSSPVGTGPLIRQSLLTGPTSDVNYVHDQSVPSTNWMIHHNLGKYPSVTIVDSAGTIVVGDISYLSISSLIAVFSNSFAGKAYLN